MSEAWERFRGSENKHPAWKERRERGRERKGRRRRARVRSRDEAPSLERQAVCESGCGLFSKVPL